jgi:SAM-dependent methyltransferase
LDIGCGNGRFGRFLFELDRLSHYVGVDSGPTMLSAAWCNSIASYYLRDLTEPGYLSDLDEFDVIACFAALQHVPGRANRVQALAEAAGHLGQGGVLLMSNWQFLDSERQKQKLRPWADVGLSDQEVEPGDCLLSWKGGSARRYVCAIDLKATEYLAGQAVLRLLDHFFSDGRSGSENLYSVMVAPRSSADSSSKHSPAKGVLQPTAGQV